VLTPEQFVNAARGYFMSAITDPRFTDSRIVEETIALLVELRSRVYTANLEKGCQDFHSVPQLP
jgi:hypothetical protein